MTRLVVAFALGAILAGNANAQGSLRFKTHLEGFNLAGAPVATNATGQAIVEVIDGGTALAFRVNVAGINNLLMAHIHVAPQPVTVTDPSGPVAFWFTGGPPPRDVVRERTDGRLAQGFIITDGQVAVWDASDPEAGSVQGLINAIREGRASVIVHTDDLDPSTATGVAGDSRAGELRGTLTLH